MRVLSTILTLTLASAALADDRPPVRERHLFRRGEPVPDWIVVPVLKPLRFDMDACVLRRADGTVDVHPAEAPRTGSSLMVGDPLPPGQIVRFQGSPTRLWAHPCEGGEAGTS